MEINSDVIVEVSLKPNDLYTPFRWERGNFVRWITAGVLCLIFYDLYKDTSGALLSFPDGKSILAILLVLVAFILLALLLFPYLRWRGAPKISDIDEAAPTDNRGNGDRH